MQDPATTPTPEQVQGLTTFGWIFMSVSIAFCVSLFGYCFVKTLLSDASNDNMHSPADIDTGDRGT